MNKKKRAHTNINLGDALKEVSKEPTVRLNVDVPESLYYAYKYLALQQRIPMSKSIIKHMVYKVRKESQE